MTFNRVFIALPLLAAAAQAQALTANTISARWVQGDPFANPSVTPHNIADAEALLGLQAGDPLPCDVARMEPHAALVDILMKNQPTPVVQAARARGLVAQPGFEMMIQQTALYLDFFGLHEAARQVRADSRFIREAIYPESMRGEIPLAQQARP